MDYEAIALEYHENGFGVVPGFFSSEELAVVDRQLRLFLQESLSDLEPGEAYYEDGGSGAVRCVFRINQRSDFFASLMWDPRLIALVEALYPGLAAEADGVMLIDKAPYATYQFPYHQDNAYQFWNPAEAVAVTLALDEANDRNGSIVCLKGSHNAPILPHRASGVTGASLGLMEKPDLGRHPEVSLDLKPGDLSLHHVNVIHRTGRESHCRSQAQPRLRLPLFPGPAGPGGPTPATRNIWAGSTPRSGRRTEQSMLSA